MVVPRGHWQKWENRKAFADSLATKYGWSQMEDWYQLKKEHFKKNRGDGLLAGTFGGSPLAFLRDIFPTYQWLPWKLVNVPQGFWSEPANVRSFLDWMAVKRGYKTLDAFYSVSQKDFKEDGAPLDKFNCNRIEMLRFAYPCREWPEWKFRQCQTGFLDDIENLRKAIKALEIELNISSPAGWYNYTARIIDTRLGAGLLANKFGWSYSNLLKTVYPHYPWKDYMFYKAPVGFWQSMENKQRWFVDFMAHMGFVSYEDVYRTTFEDVCNFYGRGLIDGYGGSYIRAFQDIIPEFPWEEDRFRKGQISKGEKERLDYLEISEGPIYRQYRVDGTKSSLDGARPDKKIGYLYHGDYWHGHPRFPREAINPTNKKSFGKLYEETQKNESFFKDAGWTLNVVWEFDWKRGKNAVKILQKIWRRSKPSSRRIVAVTTAPQPPKQSMTIADYFLAPRPTPHPPSAPATPPSTP